MSKSLGDPLLPIRTLPSTSYPSQAWTPKRTAGVALLLAVGLWALHNMHEPHTTTPAPFYHSVRTHDDLCLGGVSHSGYIGLQGDGEDAPRRAFFWCVSSLSARAFAGLTHVM